MNRRFTVGYLRSTAARNKQVSWPEAVRPAKLPGKFKRHKGTHTVTEKDVGHAKIRLDDLR